MVTARRRERFKPPDVHQRIAPVGKHAAFPDEAELQGQIEVSPRPPKRRRGDDAGTRKLPEGRFAAAQKSQGAGRIDEAAPAPPAVLHAPDKAGDFGHAYRAAAGMNGDAAARYKSAAAATDGTPRP
jgi:hypothetical protein